MNLENIWQIQNPYLVGQHYSLLNPYYILNDLPLRSFDLTWRELFEIQCVSSLCVRNVAFANAELFESIGSPNILLRVSLMLPPEQGAGDIIWNTVEGLIIS
ncbi:hypothetical protein BpHYR1_041236 [Brachionus plicatilis]|uniref:Uncharacterized protein n=1 Tax=Brachionus plicatilis TaxID=10195 RepID=A0A3M7PMK8_BRAPC|nr:hypothetical protein BpHYR1_041236 [Brachionus plicatilis]